MSQGFYCFDQGKGPQSLAPSPGPYPRSGWNKSVIVGKSQAFWYIQRGQVTDNLDSEKFLMEDDTPIGNSRRGGSRYYPRTSMLHRAAAPQLEDQYCQR